MNAIERVQAVLQGRRPDRPPVSFWHHFRPDQAWGPAALRAHLDHLQTYDLDFLKVMNDNGYPHGEPIRDLRGLASVGELSGNEPEFVRQLDLLADLRRELRGRTLMATTIFNAFMVFRHLIRPPTEYNPPEMEAAGDEPSRLIKDMYAQDPDAVRRALRTISQNLALFARRCIEAGADGIFLSVRDDWLDEPGGQRKLYDQLVRESDLEILVEARGRFNILHVCGRPVNFQAFGAYPVHVINWADRAAGPSIAEVKRWLKPVICAGVDNLSTLPHGTPEDVRREVADALHQAGDRPIMIAPGCTYDPKRVPRENLEALSRSVRQVTAPGASGHPTQ